MLEGQLARRPSFPIAKHEKPLGRDAGKGEEGREHLICSVLIWGDPLLHLDNRKTVRNGPRGTPAKVPLAVRFTVKK